MEAIWLKCVFFIFSQGSPFVWCSRTILLFSSRRNCEEISCGGQGEIPFKDILSGAPVAPWLGRAK